MAQATIDFTSSLYLGIRHPSRSLRTWLQLTTGKPAGPARVMQPYIQLDPDRLPGAVRLKLAKDVVDGRAWRKAVARQVAPRAAGAQQIQNGVHRYPHVGLARSSASDASGISDSSRTHSASLRSLG